MKLINLSKYCNCIVYDDFIRFLKSCVIVCADNGYIPEDLEFEVDDFLNELYTQFPHCFDVYDSYIQRYYSKAKRKKKGFIYEKK